jgi:hypothetical protein
LISRENKWGLAFVFIVPGLRSLASLTLFLFHIACCHDADVPMIACASIIYILLMAGVA